MWFAENVTCGAYRSWQETCVEWGDDFLFFILFFYYFTGIVFVFLSVCTEFSFSWGDFPRGVNFKYFFTKFEIAETLVTRSYGSLRQNLFFVINGRCEQSFLTPGQAGHEITFPNFVFSTVCYRLTSNLHHGLLAWQNGRINNINKLKNSQKHNGLIPQ